MAVPELKQYMPLDDKNTDWTALVGLSYDTVMGMHMENFRVAGSEHYRVVETQNQRFYILEAVDSGAQYQLEIKSEYHGMDEGNWMAAAPWHGQAAYDEAQAKVKADREEAKRKSDEEKKNMAEAVSQGTGVVELVDKKSDKGYRQDVYLRIFAPPVKLSLTLAVSDADSTGETTLTFTDAAGKEVHSCKDTLDVQVSTLRAKLAETCGVMQCCVAIILPDGRVVGDLPSSTKLGSVLAGTADGGDAEPASQASVLTACANFCMASTSKEPPKQVIEWLPTGDMCESTQQWVADSLKAEDITVAMSYSSKDIQSHNWWEVHQFRAWVLGGDKEGVVVMKHEVEKDMS
eukprot:TRINITY_DN6654_c0_g1_i1.p1 TRINITY_DN6654_c0_g1~~TRINITY_DN6654_c0_g1_i1.p1  ORF type:complete len:347 (-),score=58.97 TRINITY_DN6654_c0_g1_i1:359-1399(-)